MTSIFLKIFFTSSLLYIFGSNLNYFLKIKEKNNFIKIFKGMILMGFIALIINFFFPLNLVINSFVSLLLISFFLYQKESLDWIKLLKNLLVISVISLILVIFSNGFEPDASLYHLPATYNINNEKIVIGVSNINFRIGIISILQYVNAFNVNLISGTDGILFISAIAVSTFLIFLIDQLFEQIKLKKNYLSFFILLLVAILCLRFNRYGDFGNDALGHIFFLLTIYSIMNVKNVKHLYLDKNLNIFIAFLCLQKVFFYYLLIIPIISISNKILIDKKFKINLSHFFSISFLILWMFKSILTTGCLIYPISSTCSKNFVWYEENLNKNPNANIVSLEGEAWAKNWNKNKTDLDIKNYIKKFNWFETWKSDHLKVILTKLFPFFCFIIFLIILKLLSYNKKFLYHQKKEIKEIFKQKKYTISLIICFIGSALWFLKFPIFRYGSGFLLAFISLIFLPLVVNTKFTKKNFVFWVTILLAIFFLKNFNRIYYDFHQKPLLHKIKADNFKKIKIGDVDLYAHDYGCGYSIKLCTNYINVLKDINVLIKKNYIFIYPK